MDSAMLQRYDRPVPRYTSYPPVPQWDFGSLTPERYARALQEAFVREQGSLCLYVHLPFCEELCTYCACNKRITRNHAVEEPYIRSLLAEWRLYRVRFGGPACIREIHLGGGTPTFFSPGNLQRLIEGLCEGADIPEQHAFSVEVHPNFTTREHLSALSSSGFNRISLGVQDFDPRVQFIINREQSFEQTKRVVDDARELGYRSVNFDLIYGLPRQTTESVALTMDYVQQLMPERIAFYSYAHVPWKSKGQRRYTDADVPGADAKLAMYNTGHTKLHGMGYASIGMDHFALEGDELLLAYRQGRLHRNFMGYTTTQHQLVIGLGASAISDTGDCFAQNAKEVESYQERVAEGHFPLVNGHALNAQERRLRRHILDLMCRDATTLDLSLWPEPYGRSVLEQLEPLLRDALVEREAETLRVTPKGRLLLRNICAALDPEQHRATSSQGRYSRSI
jgi:oxygen-independent coproporphyrinogen III oxidase